MTLHGCALERLLPGEGEQFAHDPVQPIHLADDDPRELPQCRRKTRLTFHELRGRPDTHQGIPHLVRDARRQDTQGRQPIRPTELLLHVAHARQVAQDQHDAAVFPGRVAHERDHRAHGEPCAVRPDACARRSPRGSCSSPPFSR